MAAWFNKLKKSPALLMLVILMGLAVVYNMAQASSTSNVNVGLKAGGSEMYVKTGGQIKVRDTSLFQVQIGIPDVGTSSATSTNVGKGKAIAPYAGTISSIVCKLSATAPGPSATDLGTEINGVNVTGGNITLSSTAAAYTSATATPTAANTVAAGDMIVIGSDGDTSGTPDGACTVFITP